MIALSVQLRVRLVMVEAGPRAFNSAWHRRCCVQRNVPHAAACEIARSSMSRLPIARADPAVRFPQKFIRTLSETVRGHGRTSPSGTTPLAVLPPKSNT